MPFEVHYDPMTHESHRAIEAEEIDFNAGQRSKVAVTSAGGGEATYLDRSQLIRVLDKPGGLGGML